ncbi:YqaJ viral recombinase family protein [Xanthobacter sp. V2C-8]|uniref:YqaJ viral recombinase family protein n=1 Tax=Xanthobacter albus TaxID=3119929 RepID=UPI00372ABFE6
MLTPAQIKARDGKLTASRIACLMTGDEAKILNLWREMIGDPDYALEDLSGVWPVQLGTCTEGLHLDWIERKAGPVTRRGEVAVHPAIEWAACTLDGWDAARACPVETKHVGGFEPRATVIDRYMPQVHWQMIVTGASMCILSIIEGAKEPVGEEIPLDESYAAELMARAETFMECVRTLTPPVALPAVAAPLIPERVADMSASNEWGEYAATWLETRDAARKAAVAEKSIKTLVPADAKRAHGCGVEITRDRAGRLSLKEQKT